MPIIDSGRESGAEENKSQNGNLFYLSDWLLDPVSEIDGEGCSSLSNLAAWGIEDQRDAFICLERDAQTLAPAGSKKAQQLRQ